MTLNENVKNKQRKKRYGHVLIYPQGDIRFSLSRHRVEGPKHQTSLCSTGGLQTGHAGGTNVLTPLQIITPNLTFGICSLKNTSSLLHGKSLTALILAGNSLQRRALLYRWPLMLPTCLSNGWCGVSWHGVAWRGVAVNWLGLRHWTVASRGCDSISKAHHTSFSCRSKATPPPVSSPLLTITLLRTIKTLPTHKST